ncbi:MAG: hypothetical protein JW915_09855 [Chitinispirillaceae bacterium]|nr:hypothetical protein [Chitinispirillaceae bacterium]
MKKHVLYVSAVISVLSIAGCSKFEDTTSVGSDVLNDIDPSFLDNAKNYTPFDLDSRDIVASDFSIPVENDTNFGIHVPSVTNQKPREAYFPIGGKNGEVTTAYYEFETSFDIWNKVNGVDSLKQYFKVYSTVLQFDTANSGRADCNYNQKVHIFRVKDSTWKYNRNESNVKKLFQNKQLSDTLLNISNLSQEMFDTTFNNDIFRAVTDSPYKPHTFQFVVASEDTNSNYAFLKNKATLKVHLQRGEPRKSGSIPVKDTTVSDTIKTLPDFDSSIALSKLTVKLSQDTLKKVDTLINIKSKSIARPDTILHRYDTLVTPSTPVADLQPPFRKRQKSKDSTLIIDSIVSVTKTTRIEAYLDTVVKLKTTSVTQVDSILDSIVLSDTVRYVCKTSHFSIDTILETPKITKYSITDEHIVITIDTTVMKADSFSIPIVYGNNIAYEISDLLASRKEDPISSYGPRRTAVFELNLDSLWKKLKGPATATHPAFNKILSAGVAITGKYDSTFIKNKTDLTDTTITVSWCVSEFRYTNGRELFKGDKFWGIKTIIPEKETVLPIEKNLQEILSRSVNPQAKVYLYLEVLTSKHFEKQVIWSKPSLISVLTTSK